MTSSITAIGYPRATPSATPLAAAARSGSQGSPTATGSEATPALVQLTLSAAATSPGAASSGQSPDTQALSTMVQVTESSRDARARAAEEQLKQLIQQVKLLRQLGGDPKTVARQAAELAKEIGAAAKNFAAAAGSDSIGITTAGATGTPTPATAATSGTTTDQQQLAAEASQAEATAQQCETTSGSAGTGTTATTATSSATTTSPPTSDETGTPAGKATGADDGDRNNPGRGSVVPATTSQASAGQALLGQLTTAGAASSSRSQAVASEQKLFDDVKIALASLKALIDRAAAADPHDKKDGQKAVHDAEKDVDAAVDTIGQHDEGDAPVPAARINVVA